MTGFIFMRHAKTNYKDGTFIGFTDSPLTEEGVKQAREIARKLKDDGITKIYASALKRSIQTACAVGEVFGIKPESHKELNEINFGIFEGLTKKEAEKKYPEIFRKRQDDLWNFRVPGGESFKEAAERAQRFIEKELKKHNGETLLFVIHAGLMQGLLKLMAGMEWKEIRKRKYPNCCRIYLKNENNKIEVLKMAGVING